MIRTACLAALALLAASTAMAQTPSASSGVSPNPASAAKWPLKDGEIVVRDFRFRSGEVLPQLKLHYATLGEPRRDAQGRIVNAVMILHGTGGTGRQFTNPVFADVLFAPGGLLDIRKWYVILPDGIGHGQSSKPSDGLHARFPHYGYADMVEAQHRVLVDGLHVDHLRLLMGTSMGCMHAFVWGQAYPGFAQAMMPLACNAVELAGRNRIWREAAVQAIRNDPAWKGGDYDHQPLVGLRGAANLQLIAGAAPLPYQIAYPTAAKAEAYLAGYIDRYLKSTDANDLIYALNASKDYNPSADLEKITVPLTWVNSADDFINPPELGLAQPASKRMPKARFVLIPISEKTHGHGTHTWASLWQDELKALIDRSGGQP